MAVLIFCAYHAKSKTQQSVYNVNLDTVPTKVHVFNARPPVNTVPSRMIIALSVMMVTTLTQITNALIVFQTARNVLTNRNVRAVIKGKYYKIL